jgi:hypothetical protein
MKKKLPLNSKAYLELTDKLQDLLVGKKLDDVIPALSTVLAFAFVASEQDKKQCVYYIVNTIDYAFQKSEKDKEKLNGSA